jgi:hypothetical protein
MARDSETDALPRKLRPLTGCNLSSNLQSLARANDEAAN